MSYSYDDIYQLTSEMRTGINAYSISYQYDDVGNRTQMVKNSVATSYTYNVNNQLLTETSPDANIIYAYDYNGNLMSKNDGVNNTTYEWDWRNMLVSVTEADGVTAYEYDGIGDRISKTQGGVKKKFINDVGLGLVQVLMETDNAGAVQATYNYGNDLISMRRADANSFYHYDGLGTVKQLSDEAGAVVASYVYDSFGNSVSSVSSVANNYGFTGEQQFAEPDNLVFLRARYYSPQIGRFMSRDPILTPMQIESHVGWLLPYLNLIYKPQYLQPYVYALNAPINFSDPSGLSSFKECFLGCLDKMTGGITGTICAGYSGFGALIAAAAGSPTLAALLGAAPAWATGAVVGCSIGCGILELEWPPSTPPYPPPYYVWP